MRATIVFLLAVGLPAAFPVAQTRTAKHTVVKPGDRISVAGLEPEAPR